RSPSSLTDVSTASGISMRPRPRGSYDEQNSDDRDAAPAPKGHRQSAATDRPRTGAAGAGGGGSAGSAGGGVGSPHPVRPGRGAAQPPAIQRRAARSRGDDAPAQNSAQ